MKIFTCTLLCFISAHTFCQPASSIPDFDKLPKMKWQFKIKAPIFSSPVIREDVVYFGGLDSILYAVDIHSGKEKWRFRTHGQIRSSVCPGDELLYLNGGDGILYALNRSSGAVVWKFPTHEEKKYDFADYFHSTPVLANGILYFGSGDGSLYALNSKTGALSWSYATGNVLHTAPAIDHGKIFFGSFDGYVYALNLGDGSLAWKFKTVGHNYFPKGEVQGAPFAFNHTIYIGARDYNIYALDEEKGYCHWNKSFTRGWGLCTEVHDSVLYIGSADERVLIAADPGTGREFWRQGMEFLVFGNNAYSKNLLYIGTTMGKLHGISLKTGKKKWTFETNSYKVNRDKYFRPDDSYRDDIYSIIKSNEQFLDVECELGGIFTTPVISGDYLFFTSTNGTLYCLERVTLTKTGSGPK